MWNLQSCNFIIFVIFDDPMGRLVGYLFFFFTWVYSSYKLWFFDVMCSFAMVFGGEKGLGFCQDFHIRCKYIIMLVMHCEQKWQSHCVMNMFKNGARRVSHIHHVNLFYNSFTTEKQYIWNVLISRYKCEEHTSIWDQYYKINMLIVLWNTNNILAYFINFINYMLIASSLVAQFQLIKYVYIPY